MSGWRAGEIPYRFDWHPNAVEIYKHQLEDLSATLNVDVIAREDAITTLRGLVDRIVAYPVYSADSASSNCIGSSLWHSI